MPVLASSGRDYGYRNSGPALVERCEKHMKHLAQPAGYAYDSIPFRMVSSEVATDTPTTISFQLTLPQVSLQPTESLILPGHEQALMLLKDEGEHFTAALASLARHADDATVAILLGPVLQISNRPYLKELSATARSSIAYKLPAHSHTRPSVPRGTEGRVWLCAGSR